MEFKDYISRQLKMKETIITRLKEELVDLRKYETLVTLCMYCVCDTTKVGSKII